MIGHLVKRLKNGEPLKKRSKYYEWRPKKNKEIYAKSQDIPLERCEICGRAPEFFKRGIELNEWHPNARIYRHHIYLRRYFGDEYDRNTKREYFCMVCGYCHNKIHIVIQSYENKQIPITKENCLKAILEVKQKYLELKKAGIDWTGTTQMRIDK